MISYGSSTSNLVCTSTVLENFFLKLESSDTLQLFTACPSKTIIIKKIFNNCVIFLKVWHKDPYEQINKDDNKNAISQERMRK